MRRTRVVVVAVYVGVVALALAFPARSFAQDSRPLKIAYSMLSKETTTAWVAEERGFFKKNGLATNMVLIQTGTTLIQALVGGDVDIGFTAPPAIVSAVAGGVDLKIILGQANNLNFIIAAQPEIKRVQNHHRQRRHRSGALRCVDHPGAGRIDHQSRVCPAIVGTGFQCRSAPQ